MVKSAGCGPANASSTLVSQPKCPLDYRYWCTCDRPSNKVEYYHPNEQNGCDQGGTWKTEPYTNDNRVTTIKLTIEECKKEPPKPRKMQTGSVGKDKKFKDFMRGKKTC